jgi:hypothetical protein
MHDVIKSPKERLLVSLEDFNKTFPKKIVRGDLVQLLAADHRTMADAFSSNGLVLIASEKR